MTASGSYPRSISRGASDAGDAPGGGSAGSRTEEDLILQPMTEWRPIVQDCFTACQYMVVQTFQSGRNADGWGAELLMPLQCLAQLTCLSVSSSEGWYSEFVTAALEFAAHCLATLMSQPCQALLDGAIRLITNLLEGSTVSGGQNTSSFIYVVQQRERILVPLCIVLNRVTEPWQDEYELTIQGLLVLLSKFISHTDGARYIFPDHVQLIDVCLNICVETFQEILPRCLVRGPLATDADAITRPEALIAGGEDFLRPLATIVKILPRIFGPYLSQLLSEALTDYDLVERSVHVMPSDTQQSGRLLTLAFCSPDPLSENRQQQKAVDLHNHSEIYFHAKRIVLTKLAQLLVLTGFVLEGTGSGISNEGIRLSPSSDPVLHGPNVSLNLPFGQTPDPSLALPSAQYRGQDHHITPAKQQQRRASLIGPTSRRPDHSPPMTTPVNHHRHNHYHHQQSHHYHHHTSSYFFSENEELVRIIAHFAQNFITDDITQALGDLDFLDVKGSHDAVGDEARTFTPELISARGATKKHRKSNQQHTEGENASAAGRLTPQTLTTYNIGTLRALLFFASRLVNTPFPDQEFFINFSLQVCSYVLMRQYRSYQAGSSNQSCSSSSLTAADAVLAIDVTQMLSLYTSSASLSHRFVSSSAVQGLLDAHCGGKFFLTAAETAVHAVGAGEMIREARRQCLGILAKTAETRWTLRFAPEDHPLEAILESLASIFPTFPDSNGLRNEQNSDDAAAGIVYPPAVMQAVFHDIGSVSSALQRGDSLLLVLEWFLLRKGDIVATMSADPTALATPTIHTWSLLASRCAELLLSEDLLSPLPIAFCSFLFDCLNFLLSNSNNCHGSSPLASIRDLCEVAKLLVHVLDGNWVNVGVMMYYGDNSIQRLIPVVVTYFITANPVDIISLGKDSDYFFRAITAVINIRVVTDSLRENTAFRELMTALGWLLVRCLKLCAGSRPHLSAVFALFNSHSMLWYLPGSVPLVFQLLRELIMMIATNTCPPGGMHDDAVHLITRCYTWNPTEVGEPCFEELLSQCSAYHRVRVRCLLTLLRSPPADITQAYARVFTTGTEQSEVTLSAW